MNLPIYVRVTHGLANRLRTLASFDKFARQEGRPLVVCWADSAGWSRESFTDLFENDLTLIEPGVYQGIEASLMRLERLVYKNPDNYEQYLYQLAPQELAAVIRQQSFCYHGDSCLEYMLPKYFGGSLENGLFFRGLKVVPAIQREIDRIAQNFNQHTVGIHIRRGDAWCSPWRSHYQVSSDQAFIDWMNQALTNNPLTNFFLATDCERTSRYFTELFAGAVITNAHKSFFESVDYRKFKPFQRDALVDLMLLAKTSTIVGSHWSSFSSVAAMIGGQPLIIAQ